MENELERLIEDRDMAEKDQQYIDDILRDMEFDGLEFYEGNTQEYWEDEWQKLENEIQYLNHLIHDYGD